MIKVHSLWCYAVAFLIVERQSHSKVCAFLATKQSRYFSLKSTASKILRRDFFGNEPESVHSVFLKRAAHQKPFPPNLVTLAAMDISSEEVESTRAIWKNGEFDFTTAMFCAGLAFDAYAEPPKNSSRWEKGSSGLQVAFLSTAFTKSLYKGLVQIQPINCTDLPDEDDTAEGILTGSGVDASLLVAVVEGKWENDIKVIEKERYNDGVMGLQGCAHVGRSSTAWSNVNKNKANAQYKRGVGSGAYHIKSSWGKGGQAIWARDQPFYLYVQEPMEARLVFTVIDDDVVGDGSPIGSTCVKLKDLIQSAGLNDPLSGKKKEILTKYKGADINTDDLAKDLAEQWTGPLKLTSKPKIKDKKGQIAAATAAGAMVAGPAGAAVGGALASFYEGNPRGVVSVKISYLPILSNNPVVRKKYKFKGGTPGIDWEDLYEQYIQSTQFNKQAPEVPDPHLGGSDFEFCFFVTHEKTGCSCAVYRSLEKKRIVISFRGTCEPKDLLTDASIIQEPWIMGENADDESVAKVHVGFRNSLESISRRLKELILAAVAPNDCFSTYDLVVTGHSLGGALATLFTADIGQYGIDAGRGLPQLKPSEPWWNALTSSFFGETTATRKNVMPPRPKSLKLYNFGSPRVGNNEFVSKFNSLIGSGIDEAYRIVNGEDVVARLPRSVNVALVNIAYEHCGPTVLISISQDKTEPPIWIEGVSDGDCPVRDGTALTSPLAKGSLIGDIVSAIQSDEDSNSEGNSTEQDYATKVASAMYNRLKNFTASDIPSIVGLDKKFVERESKIIDSIFNGEAISHHLETQYYDGMRQASESEISSTEQCRKDK